MITTFESLAALPVEYPLVMEELPVSLNILSRLDIGISEQEESTSSIAITQMILSIFLRMGRSPFR